MVFLKILFFIFAFFYLLQWGVRLLFRWKLRSMQREMNSRAQPRPRGRRAPKEGEVHVDTGTVRDRKINDRIGDYVEYEEITVVEESEKTEE